jgi:threonine dehydrogenase-like Zn-dependent dehydrogenase
VLVLGAGTIGLMAVVAARAGGAGEILVTARRPQQKAAALALGADRVFDDADEGALFEAAGESPIDLVVESVGGSASTLDTAVATCRPGGTICLLGVYTKSIPFPALFTVAKELTIKGSFVYNRAGSRADFDVTVDLLRRHGALLSKTMITHRYPLEKIARGVRDGVGQDARLDQGDDLVGAPPARRRLHHAEALRIAMSTAALARFRRPCRAVPAGRSAARPPSCRPTTRRSSWR